MTPDYRFIVPKSPQSEHALERQWYVRVEGATYGPYDDRIIWGYVQESRVTAHSEVSLRPDRGFRPARDWLEISHWFQAPLPEVVQPSEPALETPISVSEPLTYAEAKLLLIVANIRSGRLSLFTQTLTSLGEMRALTPSTWLVESHVDTESAKEVLGPVLATSDSLLVLDASDAVFSTFNLGIEGDDALASQQASAPKSGFFRD